MPGADAQPGKSPEVPVPICSKCGRPMRLVSTEPHHRFKNLDVRNFACDCGETTYDLFTRPA